MDLSGKVLQIKKRFCKVKIWLSHLILPSSRTQMNLFTIKLPRKMNFVWLRLSCLGI